MATRARGFYAAPMRCVVCTLFERDYHLGAAVLINSLAAAGFQGEVYAGFRGLLPPWAKDRASEAGGDIWRMNAAPGIDLRLVRLATPAHLTNYKPEFFLKIEELAGAASDALVYLDPDIVIDTPWRFIEEWLTCGVALCEDINSPLAELAPRRVGWRRFFGRHGVKLAFRGTEYANGGFIGLRWEYRGLLEMWWKMLADIAGELGGADVVGIEGGRNLADYGFADCFSRTDQDALNAAIEACPAIPVSFLGRQAMGFDPGHALLAHALSLPKPWQRHYLADALGGRPPSAVDKLFWRHADGPLRAFTGAEAARQRRRVGIAAGMGRLWRRA